MSLREFNVTGDIRKFEMSSSISCDEHVRQEETGKAFVLMQQLIAADKY